MIADFFTKPLQGSKFYKFRSKIMNCPGPGSWSDQPQECVGANAKIMKLAGSDRPSPVRSYADVVRTGRAVNVEKRARARISLSRV